MHLLFTIATADKISFSEKLFSKVKELWGNWYFHDCLVILLLLTIAIIIYKMSKRQYWQLAYREVKQKKLAVVSFFILSLYLTITLADSIGWHPAVRNGDGSKMRNKQGKIITDSKGITLLDYILTDLRTHKEKTYSAPMAKTQFTSKLTINPKTGVKEKIHPKLKYPKEHKLGTDKVGFDVLYLALKGIRTAMIIGAVTTLLVIPIAILFGVVAGYFGGWIDDIIQYFYTVLSSIPSVLRMVAFMIIFGKGLPQLCIIMGITSWTGLCRVLRGETLKLRDAEFVQAAQSMGVSHWKIMLNHIVPNVMHVVLVTAILRFSGLVLAEATLSFIGIGVGADTFSWGGMINDARSELARSPMIWWKLTTAFIFMIGLILPANIFGDAVRDALDPRLRTQ